MRKTIADGVRMMAKDPERMALTAAEAAISKRYVLGPHMKAIAHASRKMNFAVSFRESGEPTVLRQSQGAATKGHDNLEKTVKLSSLAGAYGPEKAPLIFEQLTKADIHGYAGHWGQGQLLGIHLGPEALDDPRLKTAVRFAEPDGAGGGGKPYYPIDLHDLEASLSVLKATPNWHAIPVTGDNDTHDLISFSGGRRVPVPQGSPDEEKIIAAINDAVAALDPHRPADKAHKRVVQHGPQQNYVAFRMNEESSGDLVDAVARPSYPLAMCCRGEWSEIKNEQEHQAFFKAMGVNMKVSWQRPDEHFAGIGDGLVRFQRSASSDARSSGDPPGRPTEPMVTLPGQVGQPVARSDSARSSITTDDDDAGDLAAAAAALQHGFATRRDSASSGDRPESPGPARAIASHLDRSETLSDSGPNAPQHSFARPAERRPSHANEHGSVQQTERILLDITERSEEDTERTDDPRPGEAGGR
jgi:hypothetical protein